MKIVFRLRLVTFLFIGMTGYPCTVAAIDSDTSLAEPGPGALDAGAPPSTPYPLTRTIDYGVRLETRFRDQINYNLNPPAPGDRTVLQPVSLSTAFLWQPRESVSFYTNLRLETYTVLRARGVNVDDAPRLRLDKLFLDWKPLHDLRVRLGRQRVKDEREWLIDDTLDGVSLRYRQRSLRLEAGIWRERAFLENLLAPEMAKKVDYDWIGLRFIEHKDQQYNVYVFRRFDRRKDDRAIWKGVQVLGEWEDLDYWLDLATVSGSRRNRPISGIGFDVGGVYRLHKKPRIYAIGSLAYGSGDPDDVDLGFRQSGRQDNTTKLGGVTRMEYYGEVLDPDLANLWVFTVGVGTRPTRRFSINFVWHLYRQDQALDELRDSDIDARPNGRSRQIGQGFDVILGYKKKRRFKLEAGIGYFFPGAAFASRDSAILTKVESRYNF